MLHLQHKYLSQLRKSWRVVKELAAGQFKFELKEGDTVVQTATNAADGTVTFTAIEYKEAGEHTYTITEVKGDDKNIKYDENSYEVTVKVTDNGAGQLVTTVTGNTQQSLHVYWTEKEEPKEVLRVNNLREICQILVDQTLQYSLLFLV